MTWPAGRHYWQAALMLFQQHMRELNRRIDLYNLKTPVLRLQRLRVNAAREIERVTAASLPGS